MEKRIANEIKKATGLEAYELEAPTNAKYPYIVFEIRRLTAVEGIENHVLEINAWDEYKTFSRVKKAITQIEESLDHSTMKEDDNLFRIFKGQRQAIPDENKHIKRIRENFDLVSYGR